MPRYTFGPFSLDPETRILSCQGEPVPITGKTVDTLLILVQNRGRLVDKDELLSRIWAGTVVEEANLTQSISAVRKILGDNPKEHRYIATVAGRGYQFVAPVTEVKMAGVDSFSQSVYNSSKLRNFFKTRTGIGTLAATVTALILIVTSIAVRRQSQVGEFISTRLTFNSNANAVVSSTISPDGRYLAYSDPTGIHVKLISTGEERLILMPGIRENSELSYIDSWFPDGTQLLLHSRRASGHWRVWTVSVMGHSHELLREGARAWDVSPDGKRIAFSPSETDDTVREVWTMDTHGGNSQKILGLTANESLWSVHWSPDARRLAYVKTLALPDRFLQSIETCDARGRHRAILLTASDPRWIRDVAWLRDGRIVYSQLEPNGDANLWQIVVEAKLGGPKDKPKRITQWAGSDLVGLSASTDGTRLAFERVTFRNQGYLADLTERGTLKNAPTPLTDDDASEAPLAWTADSKSVLFTSNRTGKWNIFKKNIIAGTTEPLVTGREDVRLLRLSPDGNWAVYAEPSYNSAGRSPVKIMRVAVSGGIPQVVLTGQNWQDFSCSRELAGGCVLLEESQNAKQLTVTGFDPVKGRGKLLRTIAMDLGKCLSSGLSPDGSTFAIAIRRERAIQIRLLSLSGNPDRDIIVRDWPSIEGLDWSQDGKGFYCGSRAPQGCTLLYVDLNGTVRALWQDRAATAGPYIGAEASPDGHHLAIVGSVYSSNAWLLERSL
jgi:DNA-binding winged helix-turn-helix (wHTH) protein/Tol biopolymer transport system component